MSKQQERQDAGFCVNHQFLVKQCEASTRLCQACLDKRRAERETWQRRPGRKVWAAVDLTRPINELAAELGVNPRAVRYQKKKLFTQTK